MARPINPNRWVSGPDPVVHSFYNHWLRHRSQCAYRKEEYELTWEDFRSIWFPEDDSKPYLRRGRSTDSLCMIRKDRNLPWKKDNILLVTRLHQLGLPKRRGGPRR